MWIREEVKIKGIYKITQKSTGKVYISQSINIISRYGNEIDYGILQIAKNRLSKLGVPDINLHQGDATNDKAIKKIIIQ